MTSRTARSSALALSVLLAATGAGAGGLGFDEEKVARQAREMAERLGPASEADAESARKLLRKGVGLHDAGRLREALTVYQEAMDLAPLDATLHYEAALTLGALGEHVAAVKEAIVAATLAPDWRAPRMLQAAFYDDLGVPERALGVYDELLAERPGDWAVVLNKGIALLRLGRIEEASTDLHRAAELAPAEAAPRYHLSKLASAIRRPDIEAIQLRAFLELGADDPRAPRARERLKELERAARPGKAQESSDDPATGLHWQATASLAAVLLEESDVAYLVGCKPTDAPGWKLGQAKRFREGLRLKGGNRLDRDAVLKQLDAAAVRDDRQALIDALRMLRPGEPDWSRLERIAGTLALRLRPLGAPPAGGAVETLGSEAFPDGRDGGGVGVCLAEEEFSWFGYWIGHAVWRNESKASKFMGEKDASGPSIAEELFAISSAVGFAENMENASLNGPLLPSLLRVAKAGLLRGYVLLEVIHFGHGVPLDRLSDADLRAVTDYANQFVLVRRDADKR